MDQTCEVYLGVFGRTSEANIVNDDADLQRGSYYNNRGYSATWFKISTQ